MMDARQRSLKADVINLEDYHRRLTQLLERMEQLEESLKSLPLASRKYNNDDVNDNDLLEDELPEDPLLKKNNKEIDLGKTEIDLKEIDKSLNKEETC